MNRILFASALALALCGTVRSQQNDTLEQDDGWSISLDVSLVTTLNTYSDNWTENDVGSVNWVSEVNGIAEKQLNPSVHNRNVAKLAFGETYQQKAQGRGWRAPLKSTDQIDLESLFKFTLGVWVDPYTSVRLESQFWQRDSLKDRYFNPIDLVESGGVARDIYNEERLEWQVRLGIAARQTFDDALPEEDEVIYDAGSELVTWLRTTARDEWIKLTSQLKIYEALVSSINAETAGEDWRYPDIDWENTLYVNITRYIIANFTFQVLYDRQKEIDPRWKQTASLGFTYSLQR
jgi:hypothetical protein